MTNKISIGDLQFNGQTDTEQKLRRLMDDLRKLQSAVNSLIDEVVTLSDAPAADDQHVLATTSGLGPEHTVSGLTSGQALVAASATSALFRQLLLTDLGNTDLGSPQQNFVITFVNGYPTWAAVPTPAVVIDPSTIDHGELAGLADDDHPQYELRGSFAKHFLMMGA